MTAEQFKTLVAKCDDDATALDELCFKWLKLASSDYGREGSTARRLLEIAQELMQ